MANFDDRWLQYVIARVHPSARIELLWYKVYSGATRSGKFSKIDTFTGASDYRHRIQFQTLCAVHALRITIRKIGRSRQGKTFISKKRFGHGHFERGPHPLMKFLSTVTFLCIRRYLRIVVATHDWTHTASCEERNDIFQSQFWRDSWCEYF